MRSTNTHPSNSADWLGQFYIVRMVLTGVTTKLLPYLAFNGNCNEAMEFYQRILGGKLSKQSFGETMPDTTGADMKDKVIHAFLENELVSFMASDCPPGQEAVFGNSVSMSIIGSDETRLREFFSKLSAGGKILMPLDKQFWGDVYGAFTDKYGINWMVNISAKKE
ncbi:MAG: VOC family protein [archaeon]